MALPSLCQALTFCVTADLCCLQGGTFVRGNIDVLAAVAREEQEMYRHAENLLPALKRMKRE